MKSILVSDEILNNYPDYIDFIKNNPGYSTLKVRASAANEAYPISNVDIKVSRVIGEYEVVFYEGKTDSSGMINNIILPSPKAINNDMEVPEFTEYKLSAISSVDDYNKTFNISVCCGITVIQYINITPKMMEDGYGN